MTQTLAGRQVAIDVPPAAPASLGAQINGVETALTVGAGLLDPAAVQQAQATLARTGDRLRLGAEHTVVALVGATGSGKSSLFNALAGMEISEVGVRRPTTSAPKACVWGGAAADPLLDWLGVSPDHRTGRESILDADREEALHGLVLIDLPDHDSAEVSHRLEVDRLVELVDLLVWVVDPQKYADQALHAGYLTRLTGHDGVMIVVLNQIDKLDDAEAQACRDDLRRLLDGDGLQSVQLLTTSARRGDGIETMRSVLARAVQARAAVADRATADLRQVAADLAQGVALDPASGRMPGPAELVSALGAAAGVPSMLDAVEADYRRRAMAATGWPFWRWARRLRPDALARLQLDKAREDDVRRLTEGSDPEVTPAQRGRVEVAIQQVSAAACEGLPTRWADAVRAVAQPVSGGEHVADALDRAVAGVQLQLRPPGWWRAMLGAHLLCAVLVVAGFAWLALVGAAGASGASGLRPPTIGPVSLPTVLFGTGLIVGLLLALAAVVITRGAAAGHRAQLDERLTAAVTEVARGRVLDPVEAVLTTHRATAQALSQALTQAR